jgi:hypothetical protein
MPSNLVAVHFLNGGSVQSWLQGFAGVPGPNEIFVPDLGGGLVPISAAGIWRMRLCFRRFRSRMEARRQGRITQGVYSRFSSWIRAFELPVANCRAVRTSSTAMAGRWLWLMPSLLQASILSERCDSSDL